MSKPVGVRLPRPKQHERIGGRRPTISGPHVQWSLNHIANPFVRLVLRSPAHGLLSGRILLLTFRGRRSGHTYTIPVGYVQGERAVYVVAGGYEHKTWWRNLLGGAPVQLRLQGRHVVAMAEVLTAESNPGAVTDALRVYFQRFPGAARSLRVRLAADGTPAAQDLHASTRDLLVIRLMESVGKSRQGGR